MSIRQPGRQIMKTHFLVTKYDTACGLPNAQTVPSPNKGTRLAMMVTWVRGGRSGKQANSPKVTCKSCMKVLRAIK